MPLHLGLDIGGTKLQLAVLKSNKNSDMPKLLDCLILTRRIFLKQQDGYEGLLSQCKNLVQQTLQDLAPASQTDYSLGVGLPGKVNRQSRLVENSNISFLNGKPFIKNLRQALVINSIYAGNDATLSALAEAERCATPKPESVFLATLGTGVGGGLVINGEVVAGGHNSAGEWGHHTLYPGGRPCPCGRKGCAETYISGSALGQNLRDRGFDLTAGQLNRQWSTLKENPAIQSIAKGYLEDLSLALSNVINILDPNIVVIGGGIAKWDYIYEQLPQKVEKKAFNRELRTKYVKATFGDASGAYGAALLGARKGSSSCS